MEADGCVRSHCVIEVQSRLIADRGGPLDLRSDNGQGLVSLRADHDIGKMLVSQGKFWQTGTIDGFIAKFRDGCLIGAGGD